MATTNLDAFNLKSAQTGGLINEDVLQEVYDISRIPLEFQDRVGTGTMSNTYKSWTMDELGAPTVGAFVVDGADASGDDTSIGERVGNYAGILRKVLPVSTTARRTDNIGFGDALTYQIQRNQLRLRRDAEANLLYNNASVAPTDSVAGEYAGLPAWLNSNVEGGAGRVDGGFSHGAGSESTVTAATPGTPRALQMLYIDNVIEGIYNEGGSASVMMTVPKLKRGISMHLFDTSARIAQLYADQGKSREDAAALSSVSVYINDFTTTEIVPNRLQQLDSNNAADVLIFSPEYLDVSFLIGWEMDELGKLGLSDRYQLFTQHTLCVLSEKAHGMVADIDPTLAVTAAG